MEKAILKTLIYSDIFDYPLKSWEIHKWLIAKSCNLKDLEKPLSSLKKKKLIDEKQGFYFLAGKKSLTKKRIERTYHSKSLYKKAWLVSQLFRLIPCVLLVGISGSLAMRNTSKVDDIDLFIITEKRRLWLSRVTILLILSVFNLRRKKRENRLGVSGKICINILLDIGSLTQYRKNIYIAHELLQMEVLWQKPGVYQKYLEDNDWVFKMLPNWVGERSSTAQQLSTKATRKSTSHVLYTSPFLKNLFDVLEEWIGFYQKRYMGKPEGKERISDNALYFHPNDYSEVILKRYGDGLKKIK